MQDESQELYTLVYKDELTGLYNRRYLSHILAKSIESGPQEIPYSFLLMDIDFFKEINDRYGHTNGDKALSRVSALLTGLCGKEEVPIRYAGDEFVIYLPGAAPDQALARAVQVVQEARNLKIEPVGNTERIAVSLSVGAASFPENGTSWQEVLERADEALYAAKQQGRDRASLPPDERDTFRGDDLSRIFPCPRYLGQQQELQRVLGELAFWKAENPEQAKSSYLVVRGGRGVGKSRFLEEFARATEDPDIAVLLVKGSEQTQKLCYGALLQGLLEGSGTAVALHELVASHLQPEDEPLWQAFFEGSRPAEQKGLSEATAGDFVSRLLKGFAQGRRLVMLADDSELLDPEFFRFLQSPSGTDGIPALFGVFTRSVVGESEVDSAPELQSANEGTYNALSTLPQAHGLDLNLLNASELRDMVSAILPTLRTDPSFAEELHLKSQGNPLFVEEALKLLIQTGKIVYQRSAWQWQEGGGWDLPDSLESLLEARFAALDPEVRDLVAKAAVLGPNIDPEIFGRIQDTNEAHLRDLLDKARRFGILDGAARWQDGPFRFHSRTTHDVSYRGLPEKDRTALHLQLAKLQGIVGQGIDPFQLGAALYHCEMANQVRQLEEIRSRLVHVTPTPGFTPPKTRSSRSSRAPFPENEPLPPAVWNSVLTVFHLLRAAVQAAKIYPATSQTVSHSIKRLYGSLEQVLTVTPCLHISEVDGTLLANGEPPAWKGEEKRAVEGFCRSLAEVGLKGISFRRGLALSEMQEFLSVWLSINSGSADAVQAWDDFDKRAEIENIQINARVYVALSDASLPSEGFAIPAAADRGGAEQELAVLVSSLLTRLAPLGISAENRTAGLPEVKQLVEQLRKIGDLLPGVITTGLPGGQLTPDPPSNGPGTVQAAPVLPPEIPKKPEEENARSALADILSADPQREARGYEILSRMGERAAAPLYFHLCSTDDDHAGRICARLLTNLDPGLSARVQADLERNADPKAKLRLLRSAVPLLGNTERITALLLGVLERGEEALALEALHQLETQMPEQASRLLLKVLPAREDRVSHEICAALGRLGDAGCVEQLLLHLSCWRSRRTKSGIGFLQAVCNALSYFPDARVITALRALLTSTSRIPWRKQAPPDLRKAALMALERIGGSSVAVILKQCESDQDPWIRYRSKNFLTRGAE